MGKYLECGLVLEKYLCLTFICLDIWGKINGHISSWVKIKYSRVYKIPPLEIQKHLKFRLFEGQISNGPVSNSQALAMAIAIVPTIQNLDTFVWISNGFWQNGGHFSWFQMVGLLISDRNSDHLQPSRFWTIQNSDQVGFQIHTLHQI